MDIRAALHDANPTRGQARCKLQTILDDIPDDADGKDELVAATADDDWSAMKLTMTFSTLGVPVSAGTIRDHRAKRCRCFR